MNTMNTKNTKGKRQIEITRKTQFDRNQPVTSPQGQPPILLLQTYITLRIVSLTGQSYRSNQVTQRGKIDK